MVRHLLSTFRGWLPWILAGLLAGCGKPDAKSSGGKSDRGANRVQPVEVTAVERRDLADTLSLVGSLAANESAEIRPEITGIVRSIQFDEGTAVKKGDLLLKIDDAELKAQLAQVQARFELARANVERSKNLSETRTIPLSEYDKARSEYAAAQGELELLKSRLEKTEIRAPFDGVLGSRSISPGDYVTTSTVITTLNDLSRMKVDFQVPERFLAKVGTGSKFTLTSRSFGVGTAVAGEVYFVSAVIERDTRSSEAKGYLDHPPAELKPGMFANVRLVLDVRKGALVVPEGAILVSSRGTQVVAVKEQGGDKLADFVNVDLGLRAKGLVEVTPKEGSELAAGQPVVASGVGGLVLFPGAKLDPRPLKDAFKIKD